MTATVIHFPSIAGINPAYCRILQPGNEVLLDEITMAPTVGDSGIYKGTTNLEIAGRYLVGLAPDTVANGANVLHWELIDLLDQPGPYTAGNLNGTQISVEAIIDGLRASSSSVVLALQGGELGLVEGDSYTDTLTGLGDLTGISEILFGVKDKGDIDGPDDEAWVLLSNTDGLVRIAKDNPATSNNGVLSITDTVAGDISISIEPEATDKLKAGTYTYGVKVLRAAGVKAKELRRGSFTVTAGVIEKFD